MCLVGILFNSSHSFELLSGKYDLGNLIYIDCIGSYQTSKNLPLRGTIACLVASYMETCSCVYREDFSGKSGLLYTFV